MNTGFLGPAVATVLTVYGIETILKLKVSIRGDLSCCNSTYRLRYWNLPTNWVILPLNWYWVATVLTVYGIETYVLFLEHKVLKVLSCNSTYRLRYWNGGAGSLYSGDAKLQQYLPFTVLKQQNKRKRLNYFLKLQQYLPFTVLKQ